MSTRILILGAKGMLGQALVRAFRDDEVIAWDRGDLDITDRTAVMQKITVALFKRSLKKCTPSVIINTAAYNDVDGAETNAELANRVNGEAVGYLAETAAKIGAAFVHYSTDYVFDGTKKEGYREDDTPNPISTYGNSKFLGEEAVKKFILHNSYFIIRTSRLFGKQGNGKKSFVDVMLEHINDRDTISVIDEEVSSPTYVEDLAQRTREILEQKRPSGIYHITNSGACTWYEFAQEIFSAHGSLSVLRRRSTSDGKTLTRVPLVQPVPASHFPRPAKRPSYSHLLNTKLPPLRSWQEALQDYLQQRLLTERS